MTATKKRIQARRAQNRELAITDSKARCTFCRRALPRIGVLVVLRPSGETLKYCNDICRQDDIDALLSQWRHR